MNSCFIYKLNEIFYEHGSKITIQYSLIYNFAFNVVQYYNVSLYCFKPRLLQYVYKVVLHHQNLTV